MAENPLLPHRRLGELALLLERCRALERKRKPAGHREAVLAATTIHLEPGDVFSTAPGDPAQTLAPAAKHDLHEGFSPRLPRLVLAAAITRGLQLAGSSHIALALVDDAGDTAGWDEALTWAQTDRLPLVFCVSAVRYHPPARRALSWPAVERLCAKLFLPVLTVDGEDAVALYRVMQEAALRARNGHGPSLIWAVGSDTRPARRQTPSARLRRYMEQRNIPAPLDR